jgi:hypothetical protein
MSETRTKKMPPPPLRGPKAFEASWQPILLNWLVPGLGYWVIGEKGRAKALFGVSMLFLLLGFLQLQYGAVDGIRGGVYVPKLNPIEWMPTLGAAATAGAGPVYVLFGCLFGGVGTEPVRNLVQEYGATYVMVTGLLNWLCCFDIFDRATGRWLWRVPADEHQDVEAPDARKEKDATKDASAPR